MGVALYADESAWESWSGQSNLDEQERDYADTYSGYVLRIYCDITMINGVDSSGSRVDNGCCLRDDSQDGGGYCTVLKSGDAFETYFLTETNFENVVGGDDLSTQTAVSDTYDGITTFYIDKVDGDDVSGDPAGNHASADGNNYDTWEAIKFQPWPAAAWSEMYRFESGDKATGYIYDKNGANTNDKWYDETKTLTGATTLTAGLAATVLVVLA